MTLGWENRLYPESVVDAERFLFFFFLLFLEQCRQMKQSGNISVGKLWS